MPQHDNTQWANVDPDGHKAYENGEVQQTERVSHAIRSQHEDWHPTNNNNTAATKNRANKAQDQNSTLLNGGQTIDFDDPRFVPPPRQIGFEFPSRAQSSSSNASFETSASSASLESRVASSADGGVGLNGFHHGNSPTLTKGGLGNFASMNGAEYTHARASAATHMSFPDRFASTKGLPSQQGQIVGNIPNLDPKHGLRGVLMNNPDVNFVRGANGHVNNSQTYTTNGLDGSFGSHNSLIEKTNSNQPTALNIPSNVVSSFHATNSVPVNGHTGNVSNEYSSASNGLGNSFNRRNNITYKSLTNGGATPADMADRMNGHNTTNRSNLNNAMKIQHATNLGRFNNETNRRGFAAPSGSIKETNDWNPDIPGVPTNSKGNWFGLDGHYNGPPSGSMSGLASIGNAQLNRFVGGSSSHGSMARGHQHNRGTGNSLNGTNMQLMEMPGRAASGANGFHLHNGNNGNHLHTTASNSPHDSMLSTPDPLYIPTGAANLAAFIRAGHVDPGDVLENGPPPVGRKDMSFPQPPPGLSYTPQSFHKRVRSGIRQHANSVSNALVSTNVEGNTKGNAAAFLNVKTKPLPEWFAMVPQGYKPTVEQVFEALPVIEPCRAATSSTAGVIRIRNIPYSTPRSEILAFVGRNAHVIVQPEGTPYTAVHVIMERHTGKTMDSFIEFSKPSEALWVTNQTKRRLAMGRDPKIGDRIVEVELSSQEDLMFELFARARNVLWEGGAPRVFVENEEYYQGVKAAGFAGFLQPEELVMMVKHAETPHRSPFAPRCPVRCYESMITTLHKYPWFAHEHVTLEERGRLFGAAICNIRALTFLLRRNAGLPMEAGVPTLGTLKELVVAAMTCPGFSEQQKASIVIALQQSGFGDVASSRGMNLCFGGTSHLSTAWPFQVLAIAPDAPEQLVTYFANLIREATTSDPGVSLADRHAMLASAGNTNTSIFGNIKINYGDAETLAQAGRVELRAIEALLRKILPSSNPRC